MVKSLSAFSGKLSLNSHIDFELPVYWVNKHKNKQVKCFNIVDWIMTHVIDSNIKQMIEQTIMLGPSMVR